MIKSVSLLPIGKWDIDMKKPSKKKSQKDLLLKDKIFGLQAEIKKLKRQFLQQKENLENIIALMPGNVYWLDKNNVYMGCNFQQAKLANLRHPREIVGKRNVDLPWLDQAKALDEANLKVMHSGKPYTIEEYAEMMNGPGIYLSQKVPLKNKKNEITGLLGISFDITERKKIEEKLKES